MLTALLLGALAVVSGSGPLAQARPVSSEELPVDAAETHGSEYALEHTFTRNLQSSRQAARQERAAMRRIRDQEARAHQACLRGGGSDCGATAFSFSSSGNARASVSVRSVPAIVTVEEVEEEEVVSSGPRPPTYANRRAPGTPAEAETRPVPPPGNGQWVVCVSGDKQSWGPMSGRKPEGITVWANGRCELSEYSGGFDGFWSTDAGDGHEDGFASAVKGMLRDNAARVGASVGRNNPINARVNAFMQELRDRADPLDMDYPRDAALADGGMRMQNIRRASQVCTAMISVRSC